MTQLAWSQARSKRYKGIKKLCTTIDEIHSLDVEQMAELAGDRRPTTFLRRAERPGLQDVPIDDVAESFLQIITDGGRTITPGHGLIDFSTPYLREYLREHAAHLMAGPAPSN